MIDLIEDNWGWLGITPQEIVAINDFGNIIFIDTSKSFWRICPEELSCEKIADSPEKYNILIREEEFKLDWKMGELLEKAIAKYGQQPEGRCFCLKIPGVLGGEYKIQNVGTNSIKELICFSGDVARQIKDVPDGEKITFDWVD